MTEKISSSDKRLFASKSSTELFDRAWNAIRNDPNLERARAKLSISEMRAIIGHTATTDGWRDISTAPKTSRSILVYVPENKCTYAVSWHNAYDNKDKSGWQIFGGVCRSLLERPSHWQPLPPPPEDKP